MKAQLERQTGWDKALQEYLDAKRHADEACAYFAAGAVKVQTGVDLLAKFRGRMAWARDHLVEAVDEVLDRRPVSFARNGDLVMKGGNVGVCHGADSFFMGMDEGAAGTTVVPTLQCEKAWTIG